MRRCLKILGSIAMALSALFFLAAVTFWVRSIWKTDAVTFYETRLWQFTPDHRDWAVRETILVSEEGKLRFHRLVHPLNHHAPTPTDPSTEWAYSSKAPGARKGKTAAARYLYADTPLSRLGFIGHYSEPGMFTYWRGGLEAVTQSLVLGAPFWLLAILFGIGPALFTARRIKAALRRKRFTQGLCQHCGYDLRATPDRCPECGREVVAKAN